jgi:O-antigen/teichoic acid export membrane protein
MTLASLVLLAALFSADVIVARHGMDGHAAGIYAAISLAGKVVFFATSGLTWVLFPLLSARDERGEDGRGLLLGAVGAVLVVVVAIGAVEAVDPALVLVPLAGHGFAGAEPWLAPAAGAFALYAIAYLLGMGLAARRSRAGVWVLVVSVVLQLVGMVLVTPTVGHLLAVDAAAFGLAACGLAAVCLREGAR